METKPNSKKIIGRKILRLVWKTIPFVMVLLVIGLIILPLGKKISEKKLALAQKQSNETAIEKALTNVITLCSTVVDTQNSKSRVNKGN